MTSLQSCVQRAESEPNAKSSLAHCNETARTFEVGTKTGKPRRNAQSARSPSAPPGIRRPDQSRSAPRLGSVSGRRRPSQTEVRTS